MEKNYGTKEKIYGTIVNYSKLVFTIVFFVREDCYHVKKTC